MLAVFARAKLAKRGAVIREAKSGIGFVDVLITFSSGLFHVIELKILKSNTLPGPAQLSTYMKQKSRNEGWLIFFDVRSPKNRSDVPTKLNRSCGTIRTVLIDINPIAPSKLDAA